MFLRFFEGNFNGWIDTNKVAAVSVNNDVYLTGGGIIHLASFKADKLRNLLGIKE